MTFHLILRVLQCLAIFDWTLCLKKWFVRIFQRLGCHYCPWRHIYICFSKYSWPCHSRSASVHLWDSDETQLSCDPGLDILTLETDTSKPPPKGLGGPQQSLNIESQEAVRSTGRLLAYLLWTQSLPVSMGGSLEHGPPCSGYHALLLTLFPLSSLDSYPMFVIRLSRNVPSSSSGCSQGNEGLDFPVSLC